MLTVYRKNGNFVLLCQRHNDVSCCHQCLFIRQCDILSCLDSLDRRQDSDHSYDRCHQDFCILLYCHFYESVHSGYYLHIQIFDILSEFFGFCLVPHRCQHRMKLTDLRFQKPDITSGRQRRDLDIPIFSYDFQCLGSDRAGRTKYCYFFISVFLLS